MSSRTKESLRMLHREGSFLQIHLPENISQRFDSPKNVGFQVCVALERQKDFSRPKRVNLSNQVKAILDHEFEKVVGYTPYYPAVRPVEHESDIQAMLFVNVAVASDGNRYGRMCCGEFYVGGCKLVLVWCLQNRETEEVILGQRSVLVDTSAVGGGEWAVKQLTYRMVDNITEEVNKTLRQKRFPSCSSLTKFPSESELRVT